MLLPPANRDLRLEDSEDHGLHRKNMCNMAYPKSNRLGIIHAAEQGNGTAYESVSDSTVIRLPPSSPKVLRLLLSFEGFLGSADVAV